jgi:hypothetical protein
LIDVTCDCVCGLYANVTATCSFEDYLSCGNNNCSVDYSTNTARIPFAQINSLLPGESRLVTIEYHVSDHFTAPKPDYSVYLADPFPLLPAGNANQVIAIDATRYVSNSFLVEFTTVLGHPYYVQYGETVEGLVTGKTVLPPVTGTGSRVQWVDNGPPKTATPPTNGFRFYRVLSDLQ